mmetsp:Transcript_92780/g.198942  ORF Transcript_92780/g.198942 Transcript_92780/m.198942 type:complete len:321 (+) Transcript_92780:360-1322(+)
MLRPHHLMGLFPVEEILEGTAHSRHPRGATDKDHLIDVPLLKPGVLERPTNGIQQSTDVILAQLLEVHPRDGAEVVRVRYEIGHLDPGLIMRRQHLLRYLALLPQPLHREGLADNISAPLLPQVLHAVPKEAVVQINIVGADGPLYDDTILDAEQGKVEVATAHVADEDIAPFPPGAGEAIRHCSRCRSVDEVDDVQLCAPASLDDGLALGFAVARRHCNHGVQDRLAEVTLRNLPQVHQQHRQDVLGPKPMLLPLAQDPDHRRAILSAHQPRRPCPHVHAHARVVAGLEAHKALGGEDSALGALLRLLDCLLPEEDTLV